MWIVALTLSLALGAGLGTGWWLLVGRGTAPTDAAGTSTVAPALKPLSEKDAAASVFVGTELDPMLLTSAELGAVRALGKPGNISNRLVASDWVYDPYQCDLVDGRPTGTPAGYRSITVGDAATSDGALTEEAFQFASIADATTAFDTLAASVADCGSYLRSDADRSIDEFITLSSGTTTDGAMPSVSATSDSSTLNRQWTVVRVGNVLLLGTFSQAAGGQELAPERRAALEAAMRDRARLAAAAVGVGDD